MDILHFTASGIIDPEVEAYYRIHSTRNNVSSLHTHEYFEIHLVVKGTMKHQFADGSSQILQAGSLLLIRPRDIHVCLSANEEECRYINIAFSVETVQELLHFLGSGFQPDSLLEARYPPAVHLTEGERRHFLARFEKITTLPLQQKARIKTELRSLLAEAMIHYFSAGHFSDDGEGKPDWLLHLYNEMHRRENFILGVERMVELSGKSHHHVCREFKKYYHATPTAFLNSLRLNYAANMLAYSTSSVSDIAMDLNFTNLSHFHHLFKQSYKVSPAQFRKQSKG